jgi:hypothetical protein
MTIGGYGLVQPFTPANTFARTPSSSPRSLEGACLSAAKGWCVISQLASP